MSEIFKSQQLKCFYYFIYNIYRLIAFAEKPLSIFWLNIIRVEFHQNLSIDTNKKKIWGHLLYNKLLLFFAREL